MINSGFTFHDQSNNDMQSPKLPDWAVVDITKPGNNYRYLPLYRGIAGILRRGLEAEGPGDAVANGIALAQLPVTAAFPLDRSLSASIAAPRAPAVSPLGITWIGMSACSARCAGMPARISSMNQRWNVSPGLERAAADDAARPDRTC